jgi:hypothetical protein
MSQVGVKETKEAIMGLIVLGAFVAERAKDGIKLDDLTAAITKFMTDVEFKNQLTAAVDGIEQVPAEIKDLSLAEIFELAQVIPQILDLLSSLKAK